MSIIIGYYHTLVHKILWYVPKYIVNMKILLHKIVIMKIFEMKIDQITVSYRQSLFASRWCVKHALHRKSTS